MNKPLKNIVLSICLAASAASHAGVYSDDLSRCLVESTTEQDKTMLVKWMFTAMALHPEVVAMSDVTYQQRDAANKAAAQMIVSLMTEACLTPAKKAVQYEGPLAIQQAFTILGQVAGQELFSNPNVAQGLADFEKHMDANKLRTAFSAE